MVEAGTRLLDGGDGTTYRFDPSSFCLELLLTGGPGSFGRREILHAPADLADWLGGSRLARYAPLPAERIRIDARELDRIRTFRNAMYSTMRAAARGENVSPRDRELINDAAGVAPQPMLGADGSPRWASPVTGEEALGAAARDAIELLAVRTNRVRECAASECRLLFLDSSRPGGRRWCSMDRCGNRNKVQNYRARQQD